MRPLAPPPAPRDDRPASAVLHDEENVRVVAFTLRPGQRIPPHTSRSTVLVQVVEGAGTFTGDDGDAVLAAGAGAAFAPGELHAIDAGEDGVRFLAIIAPRPS
ncbi:MAG TPA: cupin domain-containing protein [Longimicrobiales bacterium]|nr:cupin domain-containing protein [Longimicrobiales bacterium]